MRYLMVMRNHLENTHLLNADTQTIEVAVRYVLSYFGQTKLSILQRIMQESRDREALINLGWNTYILESLSSLYRSLDSIVISDAVDVLRLYRYAEVLDRNINLHKIDQEFIVRTIVARSYQKGHYIVDLPNACGFYDPAESARKQFAVDGPVTLAVIDSHSKIIALMCLDFVEYYPIVIEIIGVGNSGSTKSFFKDKLQNVLYQKICQICTENQLSTPGIVSAQYVIDHWTQENNPQSQKPRYDILQKKYDRLAIAMGLKLDTASNIFYPIQE
jgi:hypothetical protein